MIHHCNRQAFIILVLFTVPFYHFLFSRYLGLTKRHFSSDILVPFPDSSDLYSRVRDLIAEELWKTFQFVPPKIGKFIPKKQQMKIINLLPTKKHNQALLIKQPIGYRQGIMEEPHGVLVGTQMCQEKVSLLFVLDLF